MQLSGSWLENLVQEITTREYSVQAGFLSAQEVDLIVEDMVRLHEEGRFKAAGVGRGTDFRQRDDIRRDEILWFDPASGLSEAQKLIWDRLEAIKEALNQKLYLGLFDLEGHYARYETGGFYQRHLDRFRSDDTRTVSVVAYLNPSWAPGDGGELEIFDIDANGLEQRREFAPQAGTLACFLSDRIEHAVRLSMRPRLSFAGWFRRRKL